MRLIFGPFWGSLSDGWTQAGADGRHLGLWTHHDSIRLATKLWMLFVARALSGILSSATSPTTMAYVSDSTTEKDRGKGMGMLGAAIGIGTIIGPGLGGLMAESSYSRPFFIAGGMSILALVLVAIFLPESLNTGAESIEVEGAKKRSAGLSELRAALNRKVISSIGVLLFMAFLSSFALTTFFGISDCLP